MRNTIATIAIACTSCGALADQIKLNCTINSVELNGEEVGNCRTAPGSCGFALLIEPKAKRVTVVDKDGSTSKPIIRQWETLKIIFTDSQFSRSTEGKWKSFPRYTLNRLTGDILGEDELRDWAGNIISDEKIAAMLKEIEKITDPKASLRARMDLPKRMTRALGKCESAKPIF